MAGKHHDFAMKLRLILEQYRLPAHGDHGVCHWARVWNGHAIASQTGADVEIVSLFALFHDACRENEYTDPEHGLRGGTEVGRGLIKWSNERAVSEYKPDEVLKLLNAQRFLGS